MPFTPQQLREYRKRLRERRVCVRCHSSDTDGRAICRPCQASCVAARRERRRLWALDITACRKCGNHPMPGKRMCEPCSEIQRRSTRKNWRRWRARKVEVGLCVECGRPLSPAPGPQCCHVCRRIKSERQFLRRATNGRGHL